MNLSETGRRIREARKKAGLSQEELAKLRRMSRATISQIETGVVPEIGLRKYLRLCDALGLDLVMAERQGPPSLQEAYAQARQRKIEAAQATDSIIGDAFIA